MNFVPAQANLTSQSFPVQPFVHAHVKVLLDVNALIVTGEHVPTK